MIKISGPIPISIYPFFWILAGLISWMNSFTIQGTIIWMFVIIVSVLVHEFGHALTAVAFGQTAQVELVGFGGVTQRKGKTKLWQEFIIILNGPIAGLLLCVMAFWLQTLFSKMAYPLLYYTTHVTVYINLFWTIINLLPVQPLDGGKLLNIILEAIFGLKGSKIALFIGFTLSGILGLLFFALNAYLAGSLFFLLTFESFRTWKKSLQVTEQDQNFILQHLLKEAEQDLKQGNNEIALSKFQRIRDLSQAGVIYLAATENTANALNQMGNFQSAYELLSAHRVNLSPEGLKLLHSLAYRLQKWEEAVSIGDRIYSIYPTYEIALMNSFSHSILGHVRPSIGWLKCAIREGLPDPLKVIEKAEFDEIRSNPLFQEFLKFR